MTNPMTDFNGYEKLRELTTEELQSLALEKLKGIKEISRNIMLSHRKTYRYNSKGHMDTLQNLIEESDFIDFHVSPDVQSLMSPNPITNFNPY